MTKWQWSAGSLLYVGAYGVKPEHDGAAVLIMAIAVPTSSCSGLTRASPTSHPSLVFHDISVLCATTDARVKPEHDAERVTTCQNENCCSARWACDNLMIFTYNHPMNERFELIDGGVVEWGAWARTHAFIG